MEEERSEPKGLAARPAQYWRWCYLPLLLGFLVAAGMVLYPPWRCYFGSGRYRGSPFVERMGAAGKAIRVADFPPSVPMAVHSHQYLVKPRYAWLFAPPRQVRGRPVRAEIDWDRLGPRISIVLLITLVATVVVAKLEGSRHVGPAP